MASHLQHQAITWTSFRSRILNKCTLMHFCANGICKDHKNVCENYIFHTPILRWDVLWYGALHLFVHLSAHLSLHLLTVFTVTRKILFRIISFSDTKYIRTSVDAVDNQHCRWLNMCMMTQFFILSDCSCYDYKIITTVTLYNGQCYHGMCKSLSQYEGQEWN